MSTGIFVGYEKYIVDGFHVVLSGLTSTYSVWIAGLFTACLTGYITYKGYETLAGRLSRPVEDVIWDVARMSIIMMFVTNAGGYLDMVVAAVNGIRDGFSGDASIWATLDTVWEKTQHLAESLYMQDDPGITGVPVKGVLAETFVWGGVFVLVCATAIVNIIAELVLMLMGVTAPIFIFFLMWGWLRPMFNNWLQTIFSCLLTTLLTGLALQVVMNYINIVIKAATEQAAVTNIITLAFQVCGAALGAAAIVVLMFKLASTLAGASANLIAHGMVSAGLNSLFPKPGKSGSTHNAVKNSFERGSNNTNRSSGFGVEKSKSNKAADNRKASIQTMQRINTQRSK
ncbi:type IV secretion system protein [Salmonella enterica subsp. enterica]|nr:type IV secretion system protein [Salmonella enterica subsp. enterica]EDX0932860.1 type IV secretion system protein [Salmonella enterica subsp. enterica]